MKEMDEDFIASIGGAKALTKGVIFAVLFCIGMITETNAPWGFGGVACLWLTLGAVYFVICKILNAFNIWKD